jgi:sulfate adenylyltransferase subunit 1 (EFTu-like GTPase family)
MGKGEIEAYSQEIIQQIRHAFSLLCEQLENYRQKRIIPIEST